MIFDASFWVSAGLFLLLGLVGRPIWAFVSKALDDKSHKIREDIEASARLKLEAEELLEGAKKKHKEALLQAEEIIKHAYKESDRLQEEMLEQLRTYREIEEKRFGERLQRIENQAVDEIRDRAVQIALTAAEEVIKDSVTPESDSELIDDAIAQIKDTKALG